MAKMYIETQFENENQEKSDIKIRNAILQIFRNSTKLISNDDGIAITFFLRKCADYPLLNDKENKENIVVELEKMEKEDLLSLSETFIRFTNKGKDLIYN